jgi:hypothetical protein
MLFSPRVYALQGISCTLRQRKRPEESFYLSSGLFLQARVLYNFYRLRSGLFAAASSASAATRKLGEVYLEEYPMSTEFLNLTTRYLTTAIVPQRRSAPLPQPRHLTQVVRRTRGEEN